MNRLTNIRSNIELINTVLDTGGIYKKQYLDFLSEELFYVQHGLIPEEISKDWCSGILTRKIHYK